MYDVVIICYRLSATKTIVMFTHSEVMMKAANIVHVLQDGEIIASAPYKELQTTANLKEFFLSDLL